MPQASKLFALANVLPSSFGHYGFGQCNLATVSGFHSRFRLARLSTHHSKSLTLTLILGVKTTQISDFRTLPRPINFYEIAVAIS